MLPRPAEQARPATSTTSRVAVITQWRRDAIPSLAGGACAVPASGCRGGHQAAVLLLADQDSTVAPVRRHRVHPDGAVAAQQLDP